MTDALCLRCAIVAMALAIGPAVAETPAAHPTGRVTIPEGGQGFILSRSVAEVAPEQRIPAFGRVISNPSAVVDINAAISGQVAEVFVLPGSVVKKGDPIATVTSPDFIFTQRSYLTLLGNEERLEILRGEGNLPNYLESARDNLRWWGMTEPQIDALVASGKLVERLNLVAPEDGIITEVLVQPGDMIDAGDRTLQSFIVLGRAVARLQRADAPLTLEVIAYPDVPLGGPEVRLQRPPQPSADAVTPPSEVADPAAVASGEPSSPPHGSPEATRSAGAPAEGAGHLTSAAAPEELAPIDAMPFANDPQPTPGEPSPAKDPPPKTAPSSPKDAVSVSEPQPSATVDAESTAAGDPRYAARVRLPRGGPDGGAVTLPVTMVAPDLDATTQQARALVNLAGLEHDFVFGETLPVEIVLDAAPGVWLPAEAVLDPDVAPVVYVAALDGTFERREIEIEDRISGRLRATDGIEPGEKVVIRGKTLLEGAYRRANAGAESGAGHHHH